MQFKKTSSDMFWATSINIVNIVEQIWCFQSDFLKEKHLFGYTSFFFSNFLVTVPRERSRKKTVNLNRDK